MKSVRIQRIYILKEFEPKEVEVIRRKYISLPLTVKEVNFKVINEIYDDVRRIISELHIMIFFVHTFVSVSTSTFLLLFLLL